MILCTEPLKNKVLSPWVSCKMKHCISYSWRSFQLFDYMTLWLACQGTPAILLRVPWNRYWLFMAREVEVTLTLKADPSHCRSALLCYSVFVYEKCHLPILECVWAQGMDSVPFRLKHLLQAQQCTFGEGSSMYAHIDVF